MWKYDCGVMADFSPAKKDFSRKIVQIQLFLLKIGEYRQTSKKIAQNIRFSLEIVFCSCYNRIRQKAEIVLQEVAL